MNQCLLITILIYFTSISNAIFVPQIKRGRPPPAKYGFDMSTSEQHEIDVEMNAWRPELGTNIWEHSGLFEGDIMMYTPKRIPTKNGLIDEAAKWPMAIVPYYIDDSFTDEEKLAILNAMQEYHNRTCIRFRPYIQSDRSWIDIKQEYTGCWSSVGMKSEGQVVNLGSEKCRRHGTIAHELMHAIGFYHQHSASDRDDFIRINWENIKSGRTHNFKKYDKSVITDYGIPYDYESVMHYSSKAFSKNGRTTIEPIYQFEGLGQRFGLSEKDVLKINSMYADRCNNHTVNAIDVHQQMQQQQQEIVPSSVSENYLDTVIKWFESIFGLDTW